MNKPKPPHKATPDNVVNIKRAVKIEPLEGWTVQTKYGSLRLNDGTDCVRLEDVHSWFLRDGKPAKEIAWKMFEPLLDAVREACDGALDAGEEQTACKLLGALRLVCADERPVQIFTGRRFCKWGAEQSVCENMQLVKARPLFSGGDFEDTWIERYVPFLSFVPSDHVKAFRSNFPRLGHHRFEDDTPAGLIYGMAEGVLRVWRGPVIAATDPVLMANISKDRADEDEYRIEWPSDESLSLALERVAIPIPIAHELWGWGRAVALQDVAETAPEQAAPNTDKSTKRHYDWKTDHENYAKLKKDFEDADGPSVKVKHEQVGRKWGLSAVMVKKKLAEGKALDGKSAKTWIFGL